MNLSENSSILFLFLCITIKPLFFKILLSKIILNISFIFFSLYGGSKKIKSNFLLILLKVFLSKISF